MKSVSGWRGGRLKRFSEERHSDARCTAHRTQARGRPRLSLHHRRKYREANADHLAVFSKRLNGIVDELALISRERPTIIWQTAKRSSERGENARSVANRKEIDGRRVLPLDQ